MEDHEDKAEDLTISNMFLPPSATVREMRYSRKINAFARAGVRSYVSLEARLWRVTRPSSKSSIDFDIDYTSSAGHLDKQKSGFRLLTAKCQYATTLNKRTR